MSKVRKGKQIAAVVMAVALSAAMVTTGVLPNTEVHVHAEEDGSVYKKIADSSVDGFYYEQNVWGYIQCTTDKTLEYSSYDEMIKKLSAITKKIVQENAYDRYSFSFPIKISSAARMKDLKMIKLIKIWRMKYIKKKRVIRKADIQWLLWVVD